MHRGDKSRCPVAGVGTEEVRTLDRAQRAASADVTVRDVTLIKPDRN
jgi:hypothetical protein